MQRTAATVTVCQGREATAVAAAAEFGCSAMKIDGTNLDENAALRGCLRSLELRACITLVRFLDGDSLFLLIISTMHADEGDDVVAEVMGVLPGSVPVGSFIDFRLDDVAELEVGDKCLFKRLPGAKQ